MTEPVALEDVVVGCRTYDPTIWTHGWVNKRAFKGKALSNFRRMDGTDDWESSDVARAQVHHGWVISVAGDVDGCGWDTTMYFVEEEPVVVDGHWDGAIVYNPTEDGYDEETPAEVVDGPHKATWLTLSE